MEDPSLARIAVRFLRWQASTAMTMPLIAWGLAGSRQSKPDVTSFTISESPRHLPFRDAKTSSRMLLDLKKRYPYLFSESLSGQSARAL